MKSEPDSDLVRAANGVLAWIDRAIPIGLIDNEAVAALRAALREGDVDDGDYIAERVAERDDQPDPPEEL